jgi:hypothetical protein
MCYESGTGLKSTLDVVRQSTADMVYQSQKGGQNWGTIWGGGGKIGNDGNGETNTGIVYGDYKNNNGYLFVLQTDGDVRYNNNGNQGWSRIQTPSAKYSYIDIDLEGYTSDDGNLNSYLWTVTTGGQTFKYHTGDGTWDTLGTSSYDGTIAIAVNEIPEFKDVLIPLLGTVIVIIFVRRKNDKHKTKN